MPLKRCQYLICTGSLCLAACVVGQPPRPAAIARASPADVPPLDVISVKPNKSGLGMSLGGADGVMGTNVTVHLMLTQGYHLNDNQVVNEPDWAKSEHFDVMGKVANADADATRKLSWDQKHVFFQQVLKERFGLVAHQETRELPEYALVIAKGGTKIEHGNADRSALPGSGFRTSMGRDARTIECAEMPIDALLQFLSNETGRVVVDKAGLTGKYTFTLSWRPTMAQTAADDAPESTPDLFTAIQEQLGLKLQPIKGPVDVLVIDHIERPTEN